MEGGRKFLGVPYAVIAALTAVLISLCIIIYLSLTDTGAQARCNAMEIGPERSAICFEALVHSILHHIATALFIAGAWHALDQIILRREWNAEIRSSLHAMKTEILLQQEQIKGEISGRISGVSEAAISGIEMANQDIRDSIEKLENHLDLASRDEIFGLDAVDHDSYRYDMSADIRSSDEFIAVMAVGTVWLHRHLDAFRHRFSNPESKTTIILIHPDSEQIEVVARKNGVSQEHYRQKILSMIEQLRQLSGKNENLKIMGHKLVSCHAAYVANGRAIYVPYFMSTENRAPPVIVVRDAGESSFYSKVYKDIKMLEKESLLIYPPV